ncbi:hypothetical protein L218DRAFT_1075001 [Marasmius fiardii PR-910]|nr:hypothetical protein L218DRAFT_1075001 [Marasmius fiardii PR-910]
MLAHAHNVTIHDGNFGTVHGNQYNNRYNGPISKRHTSHIYGETSRDIYNRDQGSQSPDTHPSAVAVFRPPIPPARPESSSGRISVHSSNHLDLIPHTPATRAQQDIGYAAHFGAMGTYPADDPHFERRSSSPYHGDERLNHSYTNQFMTPNEVPNEGNLATVDFHLSPHLKRPLSARSENSNNSRREMLDRQSTLGSSLRNTEAWLRRTEAGQDDGPSTPTNPFRKRAGSSKEHLGGSPSPGDFHHSDYLPSETTSFRGHPSEHNWDADDEHESQSHFPDCPPSETASFDRISSEQNWDADDEHESQDSERETVLMARPDSKFNDLINRVVEMGFARREVVCCMQASNNDPDLAVEYLVNGIPNEMYQKPDLF